MAAKYEPRLLTLPVKIEDELSNVAHQHNAVSRNLVSHDQLKAVYRRGAASYSALPRAVESRHDYALNRVSAFCTLLETPRLANPRYTQDNDLLPFGHALTASVSPDISAQCEAALTVSLLKKDEYRSPEHAVFNLAEYSGLGYDLIPALRAAWIRGAASPTDVPFERARDLATKLYTSQDADLLPRRA